MYTLYWETLSGAIAPQAMLEEIGVPYRLAHVDMANGAHRAPDYLRLCPTARVPCLALPDGTTIGETAAIILTLGERHPEPGLVPPLGDPDRPAFLYWLMYMVSTGYPTFSRAWHPEQFTDDDSANGPVRRTGEADITRFFDTVEGAIVGPYFLARGFTALDTYLAMLTEWVADRGALFARCPKMGALCNAVTVRPAYAGVIDRHRAAA